MTQFREQTWEVVEVESSMDMAEEESEEEAEERIRGRVCKVLG